MVENNYGLVETMVDMCWHMVPATKLNMCWLGKACSWYPGFGGLTSNQSERVGLGRCQI